MKCEKCKIGSLTIKNWEVSFNPVTKNTKIINRWTCDNCEYTAHTTDITTPDGFVITR